MTTVFFVSRLRATRPAAAAPNSRTIGGAGTGVGLPLLDPVLFPPRLLELPPRELDPNDELEEVDDEVELLVLDEVEEETLPLDDEVLLTLPLDVELDDPPVDVDEPPVEVELDDPPVEVEPPLLVDEITIPLDPPLPPPPPKNPPPKKPPPPKPPLPPTNAGPTLPPPPIA